VSSSRSDLLTCCQTPRGFPRSTLTRCDRGGCPLYSGAIWCPHEGTQAPSCIDSGAYGHCPTAHFAVLISQRLRRFDVSKPQRGFTHVHPSDLSPRPTTSVGSPSPRLSPLLPNPTVTSDARRSREQAWTLAWIVDGTHLLSLVQCDLVSRLCLFIVSQPRAQSNAAMTRRPGRLISDVVRMNTMR
jgi:hypothetical protein